MSNFSLPIGVDRNWQITIQQADPTTGLMTTCTQFILGDTLSAEVWSGQSQSLLFAPTVTWDSNPNTGIVDLSIGSSQTTGLVPGKYTLRVLVNTTDGRILPVAQFTLSLTASPGSTAAPTVYGTYQDLLAYADWLDDLNDTDADLSGFAVQRHKARAWLEAVILSRCSYAPQAPGFPFGFVQLYCNWNGTNYYIQDLLNQNRLVVTERVTEIVSRYALSLICDSMISPTDDRSGYQVMATQNLNRANNLLSGYVAEIDTVGNGVPPYLPIPVNIINSRVPTPHSGMGWRN